MLWVPDKIEWKLAGGIGAVVVADCLAGDWFVCGSVAWTVVSVVIQSFTRYMPAFQAEVGIS